MKKKLFKYIKFIICAALIFSLVAPSYASLNASDGSAFVTKAEFDSVLADFNSRLTLFEAGINSKIDSQVTSYLDRNSIWSGLEQDFVFGKDPVYGAVWDAAENCYVSPLYKKTEATQLYLGNAFLQGFNHTGTAYTANTEYAWCWFCPLFKAKKSGLAFLHLFSTTFHFYANTGFVYITISFTEDYIREPRPQYMTGNEYTDRKVVARIPMVVETSHTSNMNVYKWEKAGVVPTAKTAQSVYDLGIDYMYCDFSTQGFVRRGHDYFLTVGATRADSLYTKFIGAKQGSSMAFGSMTYFTDVVGPSIGGTLNTEEARRAECQIY